MFIYSNLLVPCAAVKPLKVTSGNKQRTKHADAEHAQSTRQLRNCTTTEHFDSLQQSRSRACAGVSGGRYAVLALLKRPNRRNSPFSISGQLHADLLQQVCRRLSRSVRSSGLQLCLWVAQVQPSEGPSPFPSLKFRGLCNPLPAAVVMCWRGPRFF